LDTKPREEGEGGQFGEPQKGPRRKKGTPIKKKFVELDYHSPSKLSRGGAHVKKKRGRERKRKEELKKEFQGGKEEEKTAIFKQRAGGVSYCKKLLFGTQPKGKLGGTRRDKKKGSRPMIIKRGVLKKRRYLVRCKQGFNV